MPRVFHTMTVRVAYSRVLHVKRSFCCPLSDCFTLREARSERKDEREKMRETERNDRPGAPGQVLHSSGSI